MTAAASSSDAVLAATAAAIRETLAKPLAPGLHIVATPIGNLGDMTLRAIAALANADVIYCEDTRHSRTLVAHFDIKTPLRAYHEYNADAARPEILDALAAGRRVALISDAGTPLISDPGYKLVNDCIAAGYAVTCVPGASAAIAALAVSGLPTDQFLFVGFLPPKQQARQTRLRELAAQPSTLVLYEAPQRVVALLEDVAAIMGPREVVTARELTKLHEDIRRGTGEELAVHFAATEPKGEFVVLIAPSPVPVLTDIEIEQRLKTALEHMSLKDAASSVAEALGLPRTRIYDLALDLKRRA